MSTSSQTLDQPRLADQESAVVALAAIFEAFSHLPAAEIHLPHHIPVQVQISLHDSLTAFEQWRAALGIDPGAVSLHTNLDGSLLWLKGEIAFSGATVTLTGFGLPVAAREVEQVAS